MTDTLNPARDLRAELDALDAPAADEAPARDLRAELDALDAPASETARRLDDDGTFAALAAEREREREIALAKAFLASRAARLKADLDQEFGPQRPAVRDEDDIYFGEVLREIGRIPAGHAPKLAGAFLRQVAGKLADPAIDPETLEGDAAASAYLARGMRARSREWSAFGERNIRGTPVRDIEDMTKIRSDSIANFARDTSKWLQSQVGQAIGFGGPMLAAGRVLGMGGLLATSMPMGIGEVRQALEDEGITDERLLQQYGWIAGVAIGALDAVVPAEILTSEVRRGLSKYILTRMARTAAKLGAEEAMTEALQEAIQIAAVAEARGLTVGETRVSENVYNVGKELFEKRWQIAEAGAGGAIGGVTLGSGRIAEAGFRPPKSGKERLDDLERRIERTAPPVREAKARVSPSGQKTAVDVEPSAEPGADEAPGAVRPSLPEKAETPTPAAPPASPEEANAELARLVTVRTPQAEARRRQLLDWLEQQNSDVGSRMSDVGEHTGAAIAAGRTSDFRHPTADIQAARREEDAVLDELAELFADRTPQSTPRRRELLLRLKEIKGATPRLTQAATPEIAAARQELDDLLGDNTSAGRERRSELADWLGQHDPNRFIGTGVYWRAPAGSYGFEDREEFRAAADEENIITPESIQAGDIFVEANGRFHQVQAREPSQRGAYITVLSGRVRAEPDRIHGVQERRISAADFGVELREGNARRLIAAAKPQDAAAPERAAPPSGSALRAAPEGQPSVARQGGTEGKRHGLAAMAAPRALTPAENAAAEAIAAQLRAVEGDAAAFDAVVEHLAGERKITNAMLTAALKDYGGSSYFEGGRAGWAKTVRQRRTEMRRQYGLGATIERMHGRTEEETTQAPAATATAAEAIAAVGAALAAGRQGRPAAAQPALGSSAERAARGPAPAGDLAARVTAAASKAKLAAIAEEAGIELPDAVFNGTPETIRAWILDAAQERPRGPARGAPGEAAAPTAPRTALPQGAAPIDPVVAFADRVLATAEKLPDQYGRPPGHADHIGRLSIAAVYDAYGRDHPDAGKLADFKRRLVEAAQRRELLLTRADLPERMDREERQRSETPWYSDRVHFVRIHDNDVSGRSRPERPSKRPPAAAPTGPPPAAASAPALTGDERTVGDAILDHFAATNTWGKRLMLADLRKRITPAQMPQERFKAALLGLQSKQLAVIYQLDNRPDITGADRAAAIHVGGEPRHLIRMDTVAQGRLERALAEKAPGEAAAPAEEAAADPTLADLRRKFAAVLASRIPRGQWLEETGATPQRLQALIDEAIADGRLRVDKNGVVRRSGKAVPGFLPAPAPAALNTTVVRTHVEALAAAGIDKAAFDRALAALKSDRAVRKAEADAVANIYTGGRGKWPTKGAALESVESWFAHRAYQAVKMVQVEKTVLSGRRSSEQVVADDAAEALTAIRRRLDDFMHEAPAPPARPSVPAVDAAVGDSGRQRMQEAAWSEPDEMLAYALQDMPVLTKALEKLRQASPAELSDPGERGVVRQTEMSGNLVFQSVRLAGGKRDLEARIRAGGTAVSAADEALARALQNDMPAWQSAIEALLRTPAAEMAGRSGELVERAAAAGEAALQAVRGIAQMRGLRPSAEVGSEVPFDPVLYHSDFESDQPNRPGEHVRVRKSPIVRGQARRAAVILRGQVRGGAAAPEKVGRTAPAPAAAAAEAAPPALPAAAAAYFERLREVDRKANAREPSAAAEAQAVLADLSSDRTVGKAGMAALANAYRNYVTGDTYVYRFDTRKAAHWAIRDTYIERFEGASKRAIIERITRWPGEAQPAAAAATPPPAGDLGAADAIVQFVRDVVAAAQTIPISRPDTVTGRIGPAMVFIAAAWRAYAAAHPESGLDLEQFKLRLVEAWEAKAIALSIGNILEPYWKAAQAESLTYRTPEIAAEVARDPGVHSRTWHWSVIHLGDTAELIAAAPGLAAASAAAAPDPAALPGAAVHPWIAAISDADYAPLRLRIRNAYLAVTGGRFDHRVLLSDLREKLSDIDRPTLDAALKRMNAEREGALYHLDRRTDLGSARAAAVEAAAIPIGPGRHLLFMTEADVAKADAKWAAFEPAPAEPLQPDPAVVARIEAAVAERQATTGRPVAAIVVDYAYQLEGARGDPAAADAIIAEIKSDRLVKKDDMLDLAALLGAKLPKRTTKTAAQAEVAARAAAPVTAAGEDAIMDDAAIAQQMQEAADAERASLRRAAPEVPEGAPAEDVRRPEEGRDAGAARPDDRAAGAGALRDDRGADADQQELAAGLPGAGEEAGGDPARGGRDRAARDRAAAERIAAETRAQAEAERVDRARRNYRISDADEIGAGGPKAKVRGNIEAIRIVRRLEEEKREAGEEEKRALVKYVGWGAFAQDLFAEHKPEWAAERQQLKDLLSQDEYAAARASTLNAYYTSADIIRGMWDGLGHLGFDGGRVLEPSAGVGHFIGLTPDALVPQVDWTAVELDPISGAITKALYGAADVRVQGFETVNWPDNFFDLAISNVPFGKIPIRDPKYKKSYSIHDYFFIKALDKIRPGGVVAFITSAHTLDKSSDAVRREIAKRATFLGAVRLPGGKQGAFAGNAGTEVTTDVIFLRKRMAGEPEGDPAWLETKEIKTKDGPTVINRWFAEHPNMMLGEMRLAGTMYREGAPVLIGSPENLGQRLADAVKTGLPAGAFVPRQSSATAAEVAGHPAVDTATDGIKEGAWYEKDGTLYRKIAGVGMPQKVAKTDAAKIRAFMELRDVVNAILAGQARGNTAALPALRTALNESYDAFVAKYGPISRAVRSERTDKTGKTITTIRYPNFAAVRDDPDAFKVAAVETYDAESDTATKAAIFTTDIIGAYERPQVHGPADALAVSLNETGRIDMPAIAAMLSTPAAPVSEAAAAAALGDQVYLNPNGEQWQTADLYLSGDVVGKLEEARAAAAAADATKYARNVAALEAVQPAPLTREDILVPFGAPWVPAEVYVEFLRETMGVSPRDKLELRVNPVTKSWSLESKVSWPASAIAQYATNRKTVRDVVEAALNNTGLRVLDKDGDGKPVLNHNATQDAEARVKALRNAWAGNAEAGVAGWVWADETRAQRLEGLYNAHYNRLVPVRVDGSHLTLPGLAKTITKADGAVVPFALRPHQLDAVWRTIVYGNTLFDHVVGSGKTYTIVASAMEQKRLGLIQRPMVVVPNHMLEQFSREWLQAYPNAKLLVADKASMGRDRRKEFAARVAAEKWDAVIITHSGFSRIRMAEEAYQQFIKDQIDEAAGAIGAEVESGAREKGPTVKDLEKLKKSLEAKLAGLLAKERKDEGITFEELGIDFIYVDEAHLFKNLSFMTRHKRIRGLATAAAQRATDLFLKIKHIEKARPGRAAVFATGTPVSNTIAELYTMQRYLQQDALQEYGIGTFDAWAATFGEMVTKPELKFDGVTMQDVTSFSRFVNIPELIQIYGRIADSLTAAQLDLPRPTLKNNGVTVIVAELSEAAQAHMRTLITRAENLGKDPKDNMLSIMTEARKLATDMRLIDPEAEPGPDDKIAKAIDNVHRVWKDGKDPALAQIVFLDMGVPGRKRKAPAKAVRPEAEAEPESRIEQIRAAIANEFKAARGEEADDETEISEAEEREASDFIVGRFNLYDAMANVLAARGIPRQEMAFIHDAKTDEAKGKLFAKVRSGEVRILFGSTGKMGTGMNVQDRLVAMHHIDAPWKPAEVEQRDGRILRQGNRNAEIEIYRYVAARSVDAYIWQTLERKAGFITQMRSGAKGIRVADDVDSVLPEAAEIKAAASGDPTILEHVELTRERNELEAAKRAQVRVAVAARRALDENKSKTELVESVLAKYEADAAKVTDTRGDKFALTFPTSAGPVVVTDRRKAADLIRDSLWRLSQGIWIGTPSETEQGELSGFTMTATVKRTHDGAAVKIGLEGEGTYGDAGLWFPLTPESNFLGLIRRWENMLAEIPILRQAAEKALADYRADIARLGRAAEPKPFAKEARLAAVKARLAEIEGKRPAAEATPSGGPAVAGEPAAGVPREPTVAEQPAAAGPRVQPAEGLEAGSRMSDVGSRKTATALTLPLVPAVLPTSDIRLPTSEGAAAAPPPSAQPTPARPTITAPYRRGLRSWVARVVGKHERFGFDRQFLAARRGDALEWRLDKPGLYEFRDTDTPQGVSGGKTAGFVVVGADGSVRELTRDEAKAVLDGGADISAALSAGAIADNAARFKLGRDIAAGRTYVVKPEVTEAVFRALEQDMHLVPDGLEVATLLAVEPVRGRPGWVRALYQTADASPFVNVSTLDALLERRAGSALRTPSGRRVVFFNRLALAGEADQRLGGELRHELVHALRRGKQLSEPLWRQLVGHAKALRVLDMQLGTFLQAIGHPEAKQVPAGLTLRHAYTRAYHDRADLQEMLDQEAVAHLVELEHHGFWFAEQTAPVRDILDDLEAGAFAAPSPRELALASPEGRAALEAFAIRGWHASPQPEPLRGIHSTRFDFDRFVAAPKRDAGYWGAGVYMFPYEYVQERLETGGQGTYYGMVEEGSRNIPLLVEAKRPFRIDTTAGIMIGKAKADWGALADHGWPHEGAPVGVWHDADAAKMVDNEAEDAKRTLNDAWDRLSEIEDAAQRRFGQHLPGLLWPDPGRLEEFAAQQAKPKLRTEALRTAAKLRAARAATDALVDAAELARRRAVPEFLLAEQFSAALLKAGYDAVVMSSEGRPYEIVAIKPDTVRGMYSGETMFALGGVRAADLDAPPRTNAQGFVLRLPYAERWGDPRFDPADRGRALSRLAEIQITGNGDLRLEQVPLPKAMGAPKREKPYTVWAAKLDEAARAAIVDEGQPMFALGAPMPGTIPPPLPPQTRPFDAGAGLIGEVTAYTKDDGDRVRSYVVRGEAAEAEPGAEAAPLAQPLAVAVVSEQPDGRWLGAFVHVAADARGRGLAAHLLDAVEADLGRPLAPDGWLDAGRREAWAARDPAAVQHHQDGGPAFDGLQVPPDHLDLARAVLGAAAALPDRSAARDAEDLGKALADMRAKAAPPSPPPRFAAMAVAASSAGPSVTAEEMGKIRARGEHAHMMSPAAAGEPSPYKAFNNMAQGLPDDINNLFQVHGLAATGGPSLDANLLDLLQNGLDPSRIINSGPPRGGSFGVDSTRTLAPYLLLSDPGKMLPETGVKHVALNGPAEALKGRLAAAFPAVNFMTIAEAEQFMLSRGAARPAAAAAAATAGAAAGATTAPDFETAHLERSRILTAAEDINRAVQGTLGRGGRPLAPEQVIPLKQYYDVRHRLFAALRRLDDPAVVKELFSELEALSKSVRSAALGVHGEGDVGGSRAAVATAGTGTPATSPPAPPSAPPRGPAGPTAAPPSTPAAAAPSPDTGAVPRPLTAIIADIKSTLGLTATQGLRSVTVEDRAAGRRWSFRPRSRAHYDHDIAVMRLRTVTDIEAIAHEGGHHLEGLFGDGLAALEAAHAAELEPLALSGPDLVSEGFAEFFRRYVLHPDEAARLAPAFHEEFEDFLDAFAPGLLEGFERLQLVTISKDYQDYVKASAVERGIADVATMREPALWERTRDFFRSDNKLEQLGQWLSLLSYKATNKVNPIMKTQQRLLRIADANGVRAADGRPLSLLPDEDANHIARMMAGADGIGDKFIRDGIPDHRGLEAKGSSLWDALVLALGGRTAFHFTDRAVRRFGSYLEARRAVKEWERYEAERQRLADALQTIEDQGERQKDITAELGKVRAAAERRRDAVTRARTLLRDRTNERGALDTRIGNMADAIAEREAALATVKGALQPGLSEDVAVDLRSERARHERTLVRARERLRRARAEAGRLDKEIAERQADLTAAEGDQAAVDAELNAWQQQRAAVAGTIDAARATRDEIRKRGLRAPTRKSADEYNTIIADLDRANPQYAQAAQMVYDWTHRLLTLEYQAGKWSKEQYDDLSKNKDWYVPFQRDLSDLAPDVGPQGQQLARRFTAGKLFKGSARSIINPIEALTRRAYETAAALQFNDMVKALANLSDRVGPGGAALIERVEKEEVMEANASTFNRILDIAVAQGMDPADAHMLVTSMETNFSDSEVHLLWSPETFGPKRPPMVPLWEDGRRKLVRLNDPVMGRHLFEAMNALGREQSNILINVISYPAAVLRAGVTMHPAYVVANILGDMQAAWILTGAPPVITQAKGLYYLLSTNPTFAAGLRAVGITPPRLAELYTMAGGIRGGMNMAALRAVRQDVDVREIRHKGYSIVNLPAIGGLLSVLTGATVGGLAGGVVGATAGAAAGAMAGRAVFGRGAEAFFAQFADLSETVTRLGVAAHAMKRAKRLDPTISDVTALREGVSTARDMLDWDRGGAVLGTALKLIPFLSSNIQGVSKAYRQALLIDGDRGRVNMDKVRLFLRWQMGLASGAAMRQDISAGEERALRDGARMWVMLMIIAAAGAALALAYRDDPEYDDIPDEIKYTHWCFKILGVWFRIKKPFELAQPANISEAFVDWAAKGDPRLWKKIKDSTIATHAPPMVPQIGRLGIGLWSGIDPRSGRPLIRQSLERLPAHMQFDAYASEFAIQWAKSLHAIGVNVSPAKIDYVLRSGLGYWGRETQVSSNYFFGRNRESPKWTDLPIAGTMVNRVTHDPSRQSASVIDLWRLMGRVGGTYDQALAGYDDTLKGGNAAAVQSHLVRLTEPERVFAVLNKHFRPIDKAVHPLNRARAIVLIDNDMRREMTLGRLLDTTVKSAAKIMELSPAKQTEIHDILGRLSALESWNALHDIGHPGWSARKIRDPAPVLTELEKSSPEVYKELMLRRRRSEGGPIGTHEKDRERWAEVKARVEKDIADQDRLGLKWDASVRNRRKPVPPLKREGQLPPLPPP